MPRGNGQIERYNQVLLDALSTMGADKDDNEWNRNLTNIQLGINSTLNNAIGVTPSEALIDFRVCSQSLLKGAEADELEAPLVDVTAIRKRMVERTEQVPISTEGAVSTNVVGSLGSTLKGTWYSYG
jgi:hypothetical protein